MHINCTTNRARFFFMTDFFLVYYLFRLTSWSNANKLWPVQLSDRSNARLIGRIHSCNCCNSIQSHRIEYKTKKIQSSCRNANRNLFVNIMKCLSSGQFKIEIFGVLCAFKIFNELEWMVSFAFKWSSSFRTWADGFVFMITTLFCLLLFFLLNCNHWLVN